MADPHHGRYRVTVFSTRHYPIESVKSLIADPPWNIARTLLHPVPYAIACIIIFGIFQFLWSIRLAYRLERYQLAPGYPILGHVLHTLLITLMLAVVVPRHWHLPGVVRATIALACIALPLLHGWLLVHFLKLGEKARRTPGPRRTRVDAATINPDHEPGAAP